MAQTLDVDQIDDVHLLGQVLGGLFVALEAFHASLVPELLLTAAATEALEKLRADILEVRVKVLTSTCHCAHHLRLCFFLVRRYDICVTVVASTGRSRENATNKGSFVFERLVTLEQVAES